MGASVDDHPTREINKCPIPRGRNHWSRVLSVLCLTVNLVPPSLVLVFPPSFLTSHLFLEGTYTRPHCSALDVMVFSRLSVQSIQIPRSCKKK